ncbi:hypothetical protein D3C73_1580600 [compost metagenome]
MAGVTREGVSTLTGELELELPGAKGLYRQGVVDGQGQAEAVVAGAQVGTRTGDLDGQPLACRDECTIGRGGLR